MALVSRHLIERLRTDGLALFFVVVVAATTASLREAPLLASQRTISKRPMPAATARGYVTSCISAFRRSKRVSMRCGEATMTVGLAVVATVLE